MSKEIQEIGEQVVTKKPWKDRNSPMIGNNGLNLEAGDNAKILDVNIKLFNMSKVDLHDPDAVAERLTEFFALYAENDMKPTVAGMGLALGLDRRRLWEIKTGNYHTSKELSTLPRDTTDCIKKAYVIMENMWETYMNSGKINPVSGIFLGKNNFGYQDKTEYVLTPNTNTDNDYSADEIRERYIAADQQKRLTTINSDEDQND